MELSTTAHGQLPAGTVTDHGTIERRSITAYLMTNGRWVGFPTVHGPYKFVEPLVRLNW